MRRTLIQACGVLAVVAVCAAVAMAQEEGGRRQGGRGRGPGGPGGGFGRGQATPLTLAGNEAVQKELGLSEDQVRELTTLSEDVRNEMQSLFQGGGNFQNPQDLSDEERQKMMEEFRTRMAENTKKITEKFQPKLDEILNDAQDARLREIVLQAAGAQAYQDPKVVEALGLTKEQQEQLASVSKQYADKQSELFAGGPDGDPQDRFAKIRELNAERDKKLSEVLTQEQTESLEKLKGKPFDVAQLRGGRGGRGGPGGPGGGGGGGGGGRPSREDRPGRRPAAE